MNPMVVLSLVAIVAFSCVVLIKRARTTPTQKPVSDEQHYVLQEKIEGITEQLNRLEEKIDAIEDNTSSRLQRECRAFANANSLTLEMVRGFTTGEIFELIEKSLNYPSDEPAVTRFSYKHDHVDEDKPSKHGYEVHGHWRLAGSNDWTPYRFLASDDQCQTWTCAETIRWLP